MNIVVRCGCGGIQKYVENSIKVLNLAAPEEAFIGKEKIRSLAQRYPGTPFADHLQALAKKSGRYAYYISTTESHEISAMYNLISGKKVY